MSWYALMTKPQRELAVGASLNRQGAKVLTPLRTYEVSMRTSRGTKRKSRTGLVLPRFVFIGHDYIGFDLPDDVTGILCAGGVPYPIPDPQLDGLLREQADTAWRTYESETGKDTGPTFGIGDLVRIVSGPFQGHTVTVAKVSKGKLQVVCRLFGTETEATVEQKIVEAA